MASSSPSWPDSAGPGPLRARLYFVRETGGIDFMAELTACARDGAVLQFEEPVTEAGVRPGDLLLVIIQNDQIEKMARLSYEADVDEMLREVDGYKEEADAEEEKQEAGGYMEEVDVEENTWSSDDEGDEDEDEGDDEQDWDDSSDELSDGEEQPRKHWINIGVWATYAVLHLHDADHWKLTRQYSVHWLKHKEMETMLNAVGCETKKGEIQTARTEAFSGWPKETPRPAFEGFLECSAAGDKFISSELSPHVHDFTFHKVLCVTSDCKVYLCSYVDSAAGYLQFALKKMQITEQFDDEGAIHYQEPREVTIFSSLKDPSTVCFFQAWACDGLYKSNLEGSEDDAYEVCEDAPNPRYVIIQMNLCFRTLDELLYIGNRVVDVEVAWTLFTEITKAVKYIHQNGVIHRDLKPGNIFLGSAGTDQVMIGDFGHSCWSKNYVDGKKGTPLRGTPMYSAPELKKTSDLTDKADIFSLGVIFAELFHCFTTGRQKCEVLGGLKESLYPTEWGGDTVLLKWLTASSPQDRPSAIEILEYVANRQ